MSYLSINLNNQGEILSFKFGVEVSFEVQVFLKSMIGVSAKHFLDKEFWANLSKFNDPELERALFKWVDEKFFAVIECDDVTDEKILCRCVSYLEKDFIKFLTENPSISESEIASEIQVGAGCGSCLEDVHHIYEKANFVEMTPFYAGLKAQSLIDESQIKGLSVIKAQDSKIYLKVTSDVYEKNNIEVIQKRLKDFELVIIHEE